MDVETLTPDAEEAAMRDMGHEADVAQGRPIEPETPPEPRAEAPEAPQREEAPPESPEPKEPELPESPEPKRDHPQQRPRDPVTGKFEKPETEYSKAQKEEIRKTRTWQSIHAEREQIKAEKAQWEEQRRMQELETARQNYQPIKKDGLTAQEYYDGALVFEREGDHENALKAYKVASELGRAEQQRYAEFQKVDQEYQWRQQLQQVNQVEPKVFDESTPIGSHVQRILKGNPWLYNVPQGFLRAAEFAHMLTQIEQMKEMQDELIELRAFKEQHQRKSQPARGGFASPRLGEKDFDEMDLNEMESHLKGMTAEADNYR